MSLKVENPVLVEVLAANGYQKDFIGEYMKTEHPILRLVLGLSGILFIISIIFSWTVIAFDYQPSPLPLAISFLLLIVSFGIYECVIALEVRTLFSERYPEKAKLLAEFKAVRKEISG